MGNMAYLRLDKLPKHRFDAFYEGLTAAGYIVNWREPRSVKPRDVLVIWNRGGTNESSAACFERLGGTTLVVENGYLGTDIDGHQLYAIAIAGHNGSGSWYSETSGRFGQLNINLKPWRTEGEHILVCLNRFIGSKTMRQPLDFQETILRRLSDATKRPARVRLHPGNWQITPPETPLEDDLKNAWAVVIWSSSAGVRALVSGVPVFYSAPYWIASEAACSDISTINNPELKDRLPALEKLAWAQWTLSEIRSGLPFRYLLP